MGIQLALMPCRISNLLVGDVFRAVRVASERTMIQFRDCLWLLLALQMFLVLRWGSLMGNRWQLLVLPGSAAGVPCALTLRMMGNHSAERVPGGCQGCWPLELRHRLPLRAQASYQHWPQFANFHADPPSRLSCLDMMMLQGQVPVQALVDRVLSPLEPLSTFAPYSSLEVPGGLPLALV